MSVNNQYDILKKEVVHLFEHLQKIKKEVASIKHPNLNIDHFGTVADQLTAIAKATEDATETIMESTEGINDVILELREQIKYAGAAYYFDKMAGKISLIFEACSFQDITGQRIAKIVKEMNLIEGTLNSLVVILGEGGLAALPLDEKKINDGSDGDVVMTGPQLNNEGVSQSDIDKLFG
ncbi:MAG: hypothetical protein A3G18_03350 [Rhodospirillales bacterium RIFCSPLOWO2_12_FULL_58_28]|nr:MAG: hypothetical protein A3H92_03295 [Rhodospirillales bacterium RIFCSPLOWO2_02_FULL_58_16]OHC77313.1 MAG: hypothetical protein A3G18_03350 [Rhodospirillales bacterium RIFCSPLOWO2_12_FULL_58_28]